MKGKVFQLYRTQHRLTRPLNNESIWFFSANVQQSVYPAAACFENMKYASVFTINIYSVSERPSPSSKPTQTSSSERPTRIYCPNTLTETRANIFVHKYGNSDRRTNVNNTETFAVNLLVVANFIYLKTVRFYEKVGCLLRNGQIRIMYSSQIW